MFLSLIAFRSSANRLISGTVYRNDNKTPLAGVSIKLTGALKKMTTDAEGKYSISVPDAGGMLEFSYIGFETKNVKIKKSNTIDVYLQSSLNALTEVVVVGYGTQTKRSVTGAVSSIKGRVAGLSVQDEIVIRRQGTYFDREEFSESYKKIKENGFLKPLQAPLSTFAIDVDAASYSNLRRFVNSGQMPPSDAVRIEEMINYFKYNLKVPSNNDPVAIHTELSVAPWNESHQLLRIGLKAKEVEMEKLPASNLVFLIDVSGSMDTENKLPLVKSSLKLLVDQLRNKDHVSIVTYAGDVGVKLPPTAGNEKAKIKYIIDGLGAGGGTAGGPGLKLAYQVARNHFIKGGNNRIIMATDGDFNVGLSSDEDMETLVSKERESGVSISVLGFGMGNYKDSKMETIADKGHGNYAYIDNITEARKSMVTEFGGTLFTVAKDEKIQVEFNPGKVQAYRLLGYENRLLEKEDFNNDKKFGGDMGVGHMVTALYEIIPLGINSSFSGSVDPLKYQKEEITASINPTTEIATIKFRYKEPESSKSRMQQVVLEDKPLLLNNTSEDFRFSSAVAELGMLLRNSEFKQNSNFDDLIKRAKAAKGKDDDGHRAEFIRLAENVKLLSGDPAASQSHLSSSRIDYRD